MSIIPFGVKPSAKPPQSAAIFPIAEIKKLCKPPILRFCLDGQDFTASQLKDKVRAFDVYERSNAIGDAIGHRHESSMRLYCVPGKSPRLYAACYQNAALVYDTLSEAELKQVIEELGLDAAKLREKISALPKALNVFVGDEAGTETGDLTGDTNDIVE